MVCTSTRPVLREANAHFSELVGNSIVSQVVFVVLAVDRRHRGHVGHDVRSNVLKSSVRHERPASIAKLRHVNSFSFGEFPLALHLSENALLKEALRFNQLLLNGGVFDEFFPDFVGGERSALVKELGDPKCRAVSDKILRDHFNRLIHFCYK